MFCNSCYFNEVPNGKELSFQSLGLELFEIAKNEYGRLKKHNRYAFF